MRPCQRFGTTPDRVATSQSHKGLSLFAQVAACNCTDASMEQPDAPAWASSNAITSTRDSLQFPTCRQLGSVSQPMPLVIASGILCGAGHFPTWDNNRSATYTQSRLESGQPLPNDYPARLFFRKPCACIHFRHLTKVNSNQLPNLRSTGNPTRASSAAI